MNKDMKIKFGAEMEIVLVLIFDRKMNVKGLTNSLCSEIMPANAI